MICGGRVPGSSSRACGGSGAPCVVAGGGDGAAFSLLVSWEEGPELSLLLFVVVTGGSTPATEEDEVGSAGSEEGGRGARKRGSEGGGGAAAVGWGKRGMGKSLCAVYGGASASERARSRTSRASELRQVQYLFDMRHHGGEQQRPCRAVGVVTCQRIH